MQLINLFSYLKTISNKMKFNQIPQYAQFFTKKAIRIIKNSIKRKRFLA